MGMPGFTKAASIAEAKALLEKIILNDILSINHEGDSVLGFETIKVTKEEKSRNTNKVKVLTQVTVNCEESAEDLVFGWDYEETLPHLKTPPSLERAWK